MKTNKRRISRTLTLRGLLTISALVLLVILGGRSMVCAQTGSEQTKDSFHGYTTQARLGASQQGQLQNLSNQVSAMSIVIDGNREGWERAIPYSSDPSEDNGNRGRIDWITTTMAHDCDDLYLRYELDDGPPFLPEGFRYNLLVDVDNNPTTGYRGIGKWLSIGADVLIQGGQDKVTTFNFTGGADQEAWGWQQIHFYPVSDEASADSGRDIEYKIRISDLDVFGNGMTGFEWVAWADYSNGIQDFYPDGGNLGDTGDSYAYTLNYKPKAKGFANPERGFYEVTQTQSGGYTPLNLATLQCYRQNEGVSLIHRFFYLENFVGSDISQEYLDLMQADFDIIRQAGLKVVIRFAYTAGPNLTPPYGDASKQRILSHLNQLSDILRNNSDVIAVMQAGFIGLWGEWWYSDHFQSDGDWNDRADVLFRILDILPATRAVQLRTPRYKQRIYSDTTPLDLVSAHNESDRARTGHHNDCFVSSMSDGGTYANASTEHPYLEDETKWAPMGGETCDPDLLDDLNPNRLGCATALDELSRFHWSFLNLSWYKPTLRKWLGDGCFSEIQKRLGYHFTLLRGTYDDQITSGDTFQFSLHLNNSGFSAPYNPRAAELIFRRTDGSTQPFKLPDDPRFWLPGKTHTITGKISIPDDFPIGDYELLLNMPDPEPELHQRPEYSIRLANENIWEANTGYNRLNHKVSVLPPPYYPDTLEIRVGKYDWGNLASFRAEDEDTYGIKARAVRGGRTTDWSASTTIRVSPSKVSKLTLSYGGQYSRKQVAQDIYLYNYKKASWKLIDKRIPGNTDKTVVQVTLPDPQAYLSSKGESRVRVRGFRKNRQRFYCRANYLSWKVQMKKPE